MIFGFFTVGGCWSCTKGINLEASRPMHVTQDKHIAFVCKRDNCQKYATDMDTLYGKPDDKRLAEFFQ